MDNSNGYNLLTYSKNIKNQTQDYIEEINSLSDINNNFRWLEQQLLENNREISVLDFYKLAGSTNSTNIFTDYNNLLKNNSLLLETSAIFNGENYAAGDIIYKQSNGQPKHLQLGGGVYYPKVNKDNTIQWQYTTNVISESEQGEDPKNIYTIDLNINNNIPMYGNIITNNIFNNSNNQIIKEDQTYYKVVQVQMIDEKNLLPIIKFFHVIDSTTNTIEEIYWDDYILSIKSTEEITDKEEKITKNYWVFNMPLPSYINYMVVK